MTGPRQSRFSRASVTAGRETRFLSESKIKIEKDTIAAAAHELKSLESQNNTIENEINSISEHISRQKNKQLQVKKNEEYQALENEIHNLVQQLSHQRFLYVPSVLKLRRRNLLKRSNFLNQISKN